MQNELEVTTGIYDGAAYWGPLTLPSPDGFISDLSGLGYRDLGLITEDGPPTITYPGEPEMTVVRAWQRARVIRTLRTPSTDPLTMTFTLAQTNRDVIEFALGTRIREDGSYTIDQNQVREHGQLIVDVITERGGERYHANDAVVTAVEPRAYNNDGTVAGWAVTVAAPSFTVWDTNLATSAGIAPAQFAAPMAAFTPVDLDFNSELIATEIENSTEINASADGAELAA